MTGRLTCGIHHAVETLPPTKSRDLAGLSTR